MAANLEVPSATTGPSGTRPRRSPSQRFLSPALYEGPSQRSGSYTELLVAQPDNESDPQRLPRPGAAPSLSHISYSQQGSVRPSKQSFSTVSALTGPRASKDDTFQPEAIWAEMQRTLADVELSALNNSSSSHVFGPAHSRALDDLRTAQLALAQAWARSEADEIGARGKHTHGHDVANDASGAEGSTSSARSSFENATVGKAEGLTSSPTKTKGGVDTNASNKTPTTSNTTSGRRRRTSSSASAADAMAADLEAETERDIQMARKRREANDRYFHQVNKGVLDVVARLDDVAGAMKQVEIESREIWDEQSVASSNPDPSTTTNFGTVDGARLDARPTMRPAKSQGKAKGPQSAAEPDSSDLNDDTTNSLNHTLTQTTLDTTTATMSDGLSDSPMTPKSKRRFGWGT